MKNKVVNKYIKALSKQIVYPGKKKKKYLSEIKMDLLNSTESNPDADYELLCENFGSPESLAKEFMDNVDPAEYKKAVSKKRVLLIAVIIAIAIWAVFILSLWIEGHKQINGYTLDYIGDEPITHFVPGDDITGYEIISEE